MAIYDYECSICGTFEVQQSIKDPPLDECPNCKKDGKTSGKPTKLISKTSFILAGGGWAADKYSK